MTDIYNDPEQIEKQEQIISGSEIFGSSSSENMLRSSDSDFDSENDTKPVKSGENQQVTDVKDPSEEIKDYKEFKEYEKKLKEFEKEKCDIENTINPLDGTIPKFDSETLNKYKTRNIFLDEEISKYKRKLKKFCEKQILNDCPKREFNNFKNYSDNEIIKIKYCIKNKLKDDLIENENNLIENNNLHNFSKDEINFILDFVKGLKNFNDIENQNEEIRKVIFRLSCKYKDISTVKLFIKNKDTILTDEKLMDNIMNDLSKDCDSSIIKELLSSVEIKNNLINNKARIKDYINDAGCNDNDELISVFVDDKDICNIIISENKIDSNSYSERILKRDITCFGSGNNKAVKAFLNNEAIRKKMIEKNYIQMHFESAIDTKHLDTVKLMLNYEDVKNIILEKEENREKFFAEVCKQGDLKLLDTLFNYMEENAISKGELINSALANAIKNNDIESFKNTIIRLHEMKSEELKTKTEVLKSKQEEFGAEKRAFFKKNSKKLESYQIETLEILEESSNKTKNEINSLKNYEKKFDNIAKKMKKQKIKLSDKNFSKTLSDLAKDVISAFEGKEVSPRQPQ